MNGKTIEIDNTDAEGRLVLSGMLLFLSRFASRTPSGLLDNYADAIYYGSTEFNAHTLIDVATLTGYVLHATVRYTPILIPHTDPWTLLSVRSTRACSRYVHLPKVLSRY